MAPGPIAFWPAMAVSVICLAAASGTAETASRAMDLDMEAAAKERLAALIGEGRAAATAVGAGGAGGSAASEAGLYEPPTPGPMGRLLSSSRHCEKRCNDEAMDVWHYPCSTLREKVKTADGQHLDAVKNALRSCEAGHKDHKESCEWVCSKSDL